MAYEDTVSSKIRTPLTINVHPEEATRIKVFCAQRGIKVSGFGRKVIFDKIDEIERLEKQEMDKKLKKTR